MALTSSELTMLSILPQNTPEAVGSSMTTIQRKNLGIQTWSQTRESGLNTTRELNETTCAASLEAGVSADVSADVCIKSNCSFKQTRY